MYEDVLSFSMFQACYGAKGVVEAHNACAGDPLPGRSNDLGKPCHMVGVATVADRRPIETCDKPFDM